MIFIMKDQIIDLIPNKSISLKKHHKYHVSIADACITHNTLKVCFEFEDYESKECFHLLERFTLGTEKYHQFITDIYCGDDGDVIAVNLSDLHYFSGYCSDDAVKDGKLAWRKIGFFESPLSSLWIKKHRED